MTYNARRFATTDEMADELQRAPRVAAGKAYEAMKRAEASGDQAAAWQARMRFDRLKSHILRLESLR